MMMIGILIVIMKMMMMMMFIMMTVMLLMLMLPIMIWTASSEFGTYRLCEQRRFRRACASGQSRQNLRCLLIQAVNQEEPSDRKPDPWPLWMAGHAQLKFVGMLEDTNSLDGAHMEEDDDVEHYHYHCQYNHALSCTMYCQLSTLSPVFQTRILTVVLLALHSDRLHKKMTHVRSIILANIMIWHQILLSSTWLL